VIHDGFNNNRNRVALDRVFAGAATHVTAELDVRFTSQGGNPADGFAMLFLPTSQYGVSGPGTGLSYVAEEPNVPNTFALGFDLYPEATQNDVSVHFGSEIANVNLTPAGINLDAGVFHHVKLDLVADGDAGSRVTVTITPDIFGNPGVPFTPIDNVLIPALRPYESRVEFAGRTGGLNLSADVDNLRLVYSSDTTSDFDGPGTPYTLFQGGSAPGPEVMSGGPDGDFLRIVHDGVNDNNNRVAFGRTLSGAAPNIRAEFPAAIRPTALRSCCCPRRSMGLTAWGPVPRLPPRSPTCRARSPSVSICIPVSTMSRPIGTERKSPTSP
jgi:hypothetical protein